MKLFTALTSTTMVLGLTALTVLPAQAHPPAISADCDGVHLAATAYDADRAYGWSVTIDGTTRSGTFGDSLDQTFPVPQDGATASWSASVEGFDGSHRAEGSGTVGPCGTVPPVDACPDLDGDQPEGTGCTTPEPPAHQTETSSARIDCDDEVQVTESVVTTTPFVLDVETGTWVPGQPVSETTTGETPVSPGTCDGEVEVEGAQASVPPQPPAGTRVPTTVDAGLAQAAAPVLVTTAASGTAGGFPGGLALLVGGGLVLAAGATRRRAV